MRLFFMILMFLVIALSAQFVVAATDAGRLVDTAVTVSFPLGSPVGLSPVVSVVPTPAPPSNDFWVALIVAGCTVLSAFLHRIAASKQVKWLQTYWGMLVTSVVFAGLSALSAAILTMGLSRWLIIVVFSAVGAAAGAFSPVGKSNGNGTNLSLPKSVGGFKDPASFLLPFVCFSFLGLAGCPPGSAVAWRSFGFDTLGCAAEGMKGAVSEAATALIDDATRAAGGDPSAFTTAAWQAMGKRLALEKGAALAWCAAMAAAQRLGPLLFGSPPEHDPRLAVVWLTQHPEKWLP